MADLTLRHPANGANQVIPSEKFDHIAFDFPSDSVVLSKEGNDLLLSFEDGSRITLTDFYTTFSKDRSRTSSWMERPFPVPSFLQPLTNPI